MLLSTIIDTIVHITSDALISNGQEIDAQNECAFIYPIMSLIYRVIKRVYQYANIIQAFNIIERVITHEIFSNTNVIFLKPLLFQLYIYIYLEGEAGRRLPRTYTIGEKMGTFPGNSGRKGKHREACPCAPRCAPDDKILIYNNNIIL